MNYLISIFANNILPILIIAAIGYLTIRTLKFNPRPITQIAFYIFSPCLLFKLLTTNQLEGEDVARLVLITTISILLLASLAWITSQIMHQERSMQAAMILVVAFGNMGNFGLALVSFAFGAKALAYASICYITEAILINTLGILIVTMGKLDFKQGILRLLKIPSIYAVILALLINSYNLSFPLPIDRTISILSDAAIPVMIVVLGLQLYTSNSKIKLPPIIIGSSMRLLGGALVGIILSYLLNLKGVALQASVVQIAMPTAVVTTILSGEFETQPSYVTKVVLGTTICCPVILTPLLYFLGA